METTKAGIGRASEVEGRVWIWVEESRPSLKLEESIASLKLTVVNELLDATILQPADAEQITRKATQEYPKYLWQAEPAAGDTGQFVVRGELRSDLSRPLHS